MSMGALRLTATLTHSHNNMSRGANWGQKTTLLHGIYEQFLFKMDYSRAKKIMSLGEVHNIIFYYYTHIESFLVFM